MKTAYRDGDMIVEKHYHLDRLALAIGILGVVVGLLGFFCRKAPPAACHDSIESTGMLASRLECNADQKLEDIGYGRALCRCNRP